MTERTNHWTAIMRHGQAFRPGMDPQERDRGSALTKAGRRAAASVGARLAEALAELDLEPADVTIACAPSPEAKDTAAEVASALPGVGAIRELDLLAPTSWPAHSDETAKQRWDQISKDVGDGTALILVGHDPQMS
jgi:phosphohistidine phosphatase SixA